MGLKAVFTIQKLYIFFEIFSFCMVMPFLIERYEVVPILMGFFILYVTPLLLIYAIRKLYTRHYIYASFLIRYLSLFIFFVPANKFFLYAYFFLHGLMIYFFWICYNIRYFTFTHRQNRATSSGNVMIVGPILSCFVPLLSGYIITKFSYYELVAVSTLILVVLLYKTYGLRSLQLKYNWWQTLRSSKGLLSLNYLVGFWEASGIAATLYTFNFIQTKLEYGAYLSYLGLVGVIATFVITRYSDQHNKRMMFFFPSIIALITATMLYSFANTLSAWSIVGGIVSIAATLTGPFFMTIILDKIENKTQSMIGREIMLNSGRATGVLVIVAFLHFTGSIKGVFLVFAAVLAIYPLVVIIKRYYYDEAYDPLEPVIKIYSSSMKLIGTVHAFGKVRIIKKKSISPDDLKHLVARIDSGTQWVTHNITVSNSKIMYETEKLSASSVKKINKFFKKLLN